MSVSNLFTANRNPDGSPTDLQLGYFLFRISIGVNIFFHGFMRILTGLGAWAEPMAETFADTYLPMALVRAFLYVLPFIEVALGVLMAFGLYTRWAMIGGMLMMLSLIYGNVTRQEWGTAGNNMHYSLYFWIMLALSRYDCYALDGRRNAGP